MIMYIFIQSDEFYWAFCGYSNIRYSSACLEQAFIFYIYRARVDPGFWVIDFSESQMLYVLHKFDYFAN